MLKLHSFSGFCLVGLLTACGASDPDGEAADQDEPSEPPEPTSPVEDMRSQTADSPFRPGVADPCVSPPETGFANDSLCLEPPPEEVGFQLHFGPDDAMDYDDPDALAPFILEAGGEDTVCQYRRTPNNEVRFVMEQHVRVRSGTHHLLLWGSPDAATDASAPADGSLVVGENCGARDNYLFQSGLQSALGPEGGAIDIPSADYEVAPEDEGLARLVRPNASVVLEMHYVNTTDEPLLREAWANTIYTPEENVSAVVDPLMFLGGLGMEVPPQTTETVPAGPCEIPPETTEVRVIGMNGHGHAHMNRLSAWVDRADGTREPIYETFDWSEPIVAQFNSQTENPTIGEPFLDGAYSGLLTLGVGDRIAWECEVENTLDQPLRWSNQAYEAEMCNIFGYYTRYDKETRGNWVCVTP